MSEHAQQALDLATASKGKAILNSAIPGKIEEALTMLHGLGQLTEACVANPKSLDVAVWKIGGIAVALRLVELASSEKQLETTVQLFVEVIGQSWRNSEDAGEPSYLSLSVPVSQLTVVGIHRTDTGLRDSRSPPQGKGFPHHRHHPRYALSVLRLRLYHSESVGRLQRPRLPLPRPRLCPLERRRIVHPMGSLRSTTRTRTTERARRVQSATAIEDA